MGNWEPEVNIEAEVRRLAEKRAARESGGSKSPAPEESQRDISIDESLRDLLAKKAAKDRDVKIESLMKKRHMTRDDAELHLKRHPNAVIEHEPIEDWGKLSPEEFRKQSLLRFGI